MADTVWTSAGKIGIVNKKRHDSSLTYKINDVVTGDDGLYCALKDIPAGIDIENEEYWVKWVDMPDAIPTASTTTLGLVKIDGDTITIDENGVISGSKEVPIATDSEVGVVKPDGTTITVDEDGTIKSIKSEPIATYTDLGVVKPDPKTLSISEDGVLSSIGSGITYISKDDYLAKVESGEINEETENYYAVIGLGGSYTPNAENIDFDDNTTVKEAIEEKANKPTESVMTLVSSNWTEADDHFEYDLDISSEYDFETLIPSDASKDEVDAIVKAMIVSSSDNIIRAWGDVPTIDIRLLIRKVVR